MQKEKNKVSNKPADSKKEKATYRSGTEEDIIISTEIEDEEEESAPHEELDPEVLEALNVKKKLKQKQSHGVDYIPELERDDSDFSDTDDDL